MIFYQTAKLKAMIFYQTAKLKDVEDCPYFVSCSVSIPLWYD